MFELGLLLVGSGGNDGTARVDVNEGIALLRSAVDGALSTPSTRLRSERSAKSCACDGSPPGRAGRTCCPINRKELGLFMQGALRGELQDMMAAGTSNLYGEGVERNVAEAIAWYTFADDLGNPRAVGALGMVRGEAEKWASPGMKHAVSSLSV